MKKYILSLLMFFGLFVLSGCGGSDNVSNTNVPVSNVTGDTAVQIQLKEIAKNEDTFELEAVVTKKVDSSYAIVLSDFNIVAVGCTQPKMVFTPNTMSLNGGINSSRVLYMKGSYDQNCSTTQYIFAMKQETTKNGAVDTRILNIKYDAENNSGGVTPTPGSGFFNATTPLKVTEAETDYEIKVQVLENGYVAPGKLVRMKPFESKYGTVTTYEAVTATDGWAVFHYLSPRQDIFPENGESTTIQLTHDANGTLLVQDIVLDFSNTATYKITPDRNITVTGLAQTQTIQVALSRKLLNQPAEPAIGKTVVAEFLMPIYGSLSNYEAVVNEQGIATFSYISPEKNLDVNDTNITFYYKENKQVIGNTKLLFQVPNIDKVERLYIVPDNFTITQAGETKKITIITVNAQNMGISATVEIEQPNNGTDYGYFTPSGSVTTDSSGKVEILYTAPDAISGLNERNITFTEMSQNISQELNIKYDQASGPGVNYEIIVSVPPALEVASENQITVTIQEVGNANNVIADEDVHEVNLTSQFINMLTFEEGVSEYTYYEKGVKAIPIETKTLSGTAVIEISASLFNGDEDVTIHTTVPVVILSGSVTAMSLVYAGTSEDTGLGLYKNYYTIHAVDRYNNPAQEGITLHPSIINGTKVVRSASDQDTGKIENIDSNDSNECNNTIHDQFTDATDNIFDNVDTDDLLAIVSNPNRVNNAYLGNWSISDVIDSNTLKLAEEYLDEVTDKLNYIIGNASRYIDGYGMATVDIKDRNDNGYVTDKNGNVQFEMTFDPILAGHTVTISANAYDRDKKIDDNQIYDCNRTGAAIIAGLRWDRYASTVVTIPNDGNEYIVTLGLSISDGLEPLVDLDIVPESITSSDSGCALNSSADNDLHTDRNGQITVHIETGLGDSTAKECDISWSATQSGIYREY